MTLNPLSILLTQNKLDSNNYVEWKNNLDIVLMADKHKWVLFTSCPTTPTIESATEQLMEYEI